MILILERNTSLLSIAFVVLGPLIFLFLAIFFLYLALDPNWTWWIDSSFDWQLQVWIEISKDWQLQAWIDSLDWQLLPWVVFLFFLCGYFESMCYIGVIDSYSSCFPYLHLLFHIWTWWINNCKLGLRDSDSFSRQGHDPFTNAVFFSSLQLTQQI